MRRWLFNLAMAVSLLLCVAVCGLWARSHFVNDEVGFDTGAGERRMVGVTAVSYAGNCMGYWDHYTFPAIGRDAFASHATHGRVAPQWYWLVSRYRDEADYRQQHWNFGLGWFHAETERKVALWNIGGLVCVRRTVCVPHGCVALALAVCPAAWVRRWLRRRSVTGRCLACGYDLRATRERCPECGSIPTTPPQTAA